MFFLTNRILFGCMEIRNFSLSVEKYFLSEGNKQVKYFSIQDVISCYVIICYYYNMLFNMLCYNNNKMLYLYPLNILYIIQY